MSIHNLLKIHKKTIFSTNKTAVDCWLKPFPSHAGFKVPAITNFVGLTIDESGYGCYADSFELTINFDDVQAETEQIPVKGWVLDVTLPQMNNAVIPFYIEEVATDRSLGMFLIKCSGQTTTGKGKRIINGGI